MGCGCNKKANVNNVNNVNNQQNNNQQRQQQQKMPLIATGSSSAKKTALANVSKKISKRQE